MNYTAADPVGSSWTEKVLNVKDDKDSHAHLTADSNAVDDDEWVSSLVLNHSLVSTKKL